MIGLVLAASLGGAPPSDVLPRPEPVPYARLLAEAPAHVGEPVDVVLQFHSIVERWNPFLTRFGSVGFVAVQAWADEQLPWVREEYDHPAVRFYARRGSDLEDGLRGLRQHERLRVTCVVRELFAGRVWAEIVALEPLSESIPEGSVLHVLRGAELVERRAWDLADAEFERALAAPLPEHAWNAVLELRAGCLEQKAVAQAAQRQRRQRQR